MSATPKILLVDDNPVVLLKVASALRAANYQVIEAANGAECLRLAEQETPELVLLDVMLPDINGVELCRQIKARPPLRSVFVVLFSGTETSGERQATGLEAGADGYIARPIENRELVARVQAMLRIQRAEAALRRANEELEERVAERTAELTAANDRLRAVSLKLFEVQEAERRFIAQELHDEIGQLLTGLKLVLERNPDDRGLNTRMNEALQLIKELLERVRTLSVNLRPQMLDELGLLPALEWLFGRYQKQSGILVLFQHSPMTERLPANLETAVFRVAQESLTNVARYAGVKEVKVRLLVDAACVVLQVADEGKGFDAAAAEAARNSSGLAGMRERALLLGGEFTLESEPGHGTRVTMELPRTETA